MFKTIKTLTATVLFLGMGLSSAQAQPGNQIPSINDYASVIQWCNDLAYQLQEKRADAMAAYRFGNYAESAKILVNGLSTVESQIGPAPQVGPITRLSLRRGVLLGNSLLGSLGGDTLSKKTTALFMTNYYDFIIKTANDFDISYRVPRYYRNGCNSCDNFDMEAYEAQFYEFAKSQVSMVLDTLAYQNNGAVWPKGQPKGFFLALSLSLQYTARDLLDSDWGYQHACQIQRLKNLAGRIDAFLGGNRAVWPSEAYAFAQAYAEAQDITYSLSNRCGSYSNDTYYPRPTRSHGRHGRGHY